MVNREVLGSTSPVVQWFLDVLDHLTAEGTGITISHRHQPFGNYYSRGGGGPPLIAAARAASSHKRPSPPPAPDAGGAGGGEARGWPGGPRASPMLIVAGGARWAAPRAGGVGVSTREELGEAGRGGAGRAKAGLPHRDLMGSAGCWGEARNSNWPQLSF